MKRKRDVQCQFYKPDTKAMKYVCSDVMFFVQCHYSSRIVFASSLAKRRHEPQEKARRLKRRAHKVFNSVLFLLFHSIFG